MRGRNTFERAPVRLNVGTESQAGQDRRQQAPIHAPISNNDPNRGQIAQFGNPIPNQGLREPPRRKGKLETTGTFVSLPLH